MEEMRDDEGSPGNPLQASLGISSTPPVCNPSCTCAGIEANAGRVVAQYGRIERVCLTLMSKFPFLPALSFRHTRYITHPPKSTKATKRRPPMPKRKPNSREYGILVGGQYGTDIRSHDTDVGVAPISQDPSRHVPHRLGSRGPRHPAPSMQDV